VKKFNVCQANMKPGVQTPEPPSKKKAVVLRKIDTEMNEIEKS
jgi:hypothetical protein